MKIEDKEWGDLLADDVIEKHKIAIRKNPQPNYYIWPIKYVKGDTWVSEEWWLATGIELIEKKIDILCGLEIVLRAGKKEYMPRLAEVLETIEYIYDPEYWYDYIALLPDDHPIKKDTFDYKYMESINTDKWQRRALMSVKDERLCVYLSEKIINIMNNYSRKEEKTGVLQEYVMPRMAEFGKSSRIYFEDRFLNFLKSKCFELLKKDEKFIQEKQDYKLSCFREKIAYWSWSLGWHDIMEFLGKSPWYKEYLSVMFSDDYDHDNFLVWSHYIEDDFIVKKSIEMMETCILEGAIAWTRMQGKLSTG